MYPWALICPDRHKLKHAGVLYIECLVLFVNDELAYKENILHKWARFFSILDKMCTEHLNISLKETKFDARNFSNSWMLTCIYINIWNVWCSMYNINRQMDKVNFLSFSSSHNNVYWNVFLVLLLQMFNKHNFYACNYMCNGFISCV